jgi:hypothetical protein
VLNNVARFWEILHFALNDREKTAEKLNNQIEEFSIFLNLPLNKVRTLLSGVLKSIEKP